MPDALSSRFSVAVPDAQRQVRQALRLLEADLREAALLTLGAWEALGLVAPALFRPAASLQRPSWGHWNGLLAALREARKAVLRTGTPDQRERVRQASLLNALLDTLDAEADGALVRDLAPLADVVRVRIGRRPRLDQILSLAITLRNEVAHFQPDDDSWWQRAAAALAPLLAWRGDGARLRAGTTAEAYREPWFLGDTRAALNGFSDDAVRYADPDGSSIESPTQVQPLLAALRRLLGQEQAQDESLKKLLARATPAELRGVLLGDHLVRGPAVGSGGFADVYAAVQISTGRKVAVKVLHDGLDDEARARFQQEAQLLSQFNHPHIVRVLGRGEDPWFPPREPDAARALNAEPWFAKWAEGRPARTYLALEWVEGHTLEQVYQGQRPVPDVRTLTRWFAQAAEALTAVHGAGLIHRDVKPGNLMVDDDGTVTLMDFGIARTQDELRTIQTTPGRTMGTPAYLAPEQLETRGPDTGAGPSSDIYSLCATFYELYTGRRLFGHDRATEQAVNTRKLSEPHPERPRLLAPGLSWELETILMGGLQREPSARYRSAVDLHRDLAHVLRDEPIEYRRPSAARRLGLWWRRNPRVARLTTAVALLLIVLAVGGPVAAYVIDRTARENKTLADSNGRLADKERVAREDAEKSDRESTQRLVRLLVADGWRAFGEGDALAAVPLFVQALDADDRNEAAGPIHRLRVAATLRRCPRLTQAWFHDGPIVAADMHHQARRVLTVGAGTAQVWDADTGQAVGKPLRSEEAQHGGVLNPDGTRVLTWGSGARIWDAATGEPVGVPLRPRTHVNRAAFSSDGRWIKLNREWHGNVVETYDGTTGAAAPLPGAGKGPWQEVQFARAAPRALVVALTAGGDHEARMWDLEKGQPVGPSFKAGADVQVRLDDDGTRVLMKESDKVVVHDAATGRPAGPEVRHGRRIVHAALAPDGDRAVTVSEPEAFLNGTRPLKPGEAQVWDVESGQPVGTPFQHDEDITSATFAGASDRVLTRGRTQARLWDVASGQPMTPPLRHRHGLIGGGVSPEGRHVLTWGQDGSARQWDLASTDLLGVISPEGPVGGSRVHFGGERRVAVSPDGRRVLVNVLWRAQAWDAQTAQPLTTYRAEGLSIGVVLTSPDGRLVAGGGSLHRGLSYVPTAYVWDAATGAVVAGPLEHEVKAQVQGQVETLAFHPNGRLLATGAADGTARLWDVDTRRQVGEPLRHQYEVCLVTFSADGGRLLTLARPVVGEKGEVRVWDTATGTEVAPPLAAPPQVRLAALSPDGRRVVLGLGAKFGPTGDRTGTTNVVEVREVAGGAVVGRPMPQTGSVTVVAWSDDGTRVLAACANGAVRVYDADTGSPVTPLLPHPVEIRQARFDRSGRLVLCCCGQEFGANRVGEVRVWDAATGELVAPPLRHLMGVHSAALDPTGEMLVAGGEDFVRFWDLAPEKRPADDLRLLARLLSETELDANGHPSPLAPADYRAAWERYHGRTPPAARAPRPEQLLAWHTREATHAEAANEWGRADTHLDALLTARPKDEQLHARRGYARYHLRAWEDAAAAFGRALELGNTDWEVRHHRGLSLAERGRWNDALRDFDAVLREVQTEWEVYYHRGRANYGLKRYDRAEADCTEAIEVLGGKRPEFTLHPLVLEQKADVERHNGKWQPWYVRGLARHDSNKHEAAVEDYDKVLEVRPNHREARYYRGLCRKDLGQYDEAAGDFDALIKDGWNDGRPWAERGWIEAHRGRWPQAAADYAEALRRSPQPTRVWLDAALVHLHLKDSVRYKALAAALAKDVASQPLKPRLQAVLVSVLAADGADDGKALQRWCEEGKAHKVENIDLLLGAVAYRQGQWDEAQKHLRAAAAASGELYSVPVRLFLAMALHRGGQTKEAAQVRTQALQTRQKLQAADLAWTERILMDLLSREAAATLE